jgi:low-density lipoprotein receptor class B/Ig-like domain-containing protein
MGNLHPRHLPITELDSIRIEQRKKTVKQIIQSIFLLLALCMVLTAEMDAQEIMWIESTAGSPMLRRAAPDGSSVTSVAIAAGRLPQGVAVDVVNNLLYAAEAVYYVDGPDADIQRWPVSFTAVTAADSVPNLGGESSFRGVTVDMVGAKLYWTSSRADEGCRIRRANLDGSSEEILIQSTVGDATNLRGIAVDHIGGMIYWCDGGNGVVKRANLDGSSEATIVTSDPLNGLTGIALDLTNNHVYWVEQFSTSGKGLGTIRRSNLDGSSPTTLVSGLGSPLWISLNVEGNTMFWTEAGYPGTAKIQKALLDGTGVTDLSPMILAASGAAVVDPAGIAFYAPCTAATITTDPVDQTICPGTNALFTAAASGSPFLSVQWQRSTDGGTNWADIAGETTPTLTFVAGGADNGNQYQAIFATICGSPATSAAAVLTVKTLSLAPTAITKSDDNVCPSTLVTMTPTGGTKGTGADYKWYSESGCTNLLHTGDTYDVSPTATTSYWVRLEGECGPPTATATTTITVKTLSIAPTAITKSDDNVCPSTPVTLTPTGGTKGTGADYKWYSESGCTNLLHTGDTYDVSPTVTTDYWVRLEGDCGPPTATATTTVSVKPVSIAPTSITKSSDYICPPTLVTLTPVGGTKGVGASYKWYSESGCVNLLHTGDTYGVTPAVTTSYWVRLEGGDCGVVTATATTTVNMETNVPTVSTQNIMIPLDGSGHASILPSQVDNGSSDDCGIASVSVSPSSFDCGDVGPNSVTLTVTDVNGNSNTGAATVTVQAPDINVAPGSFAYGAVVLGSSSDHTFLVSNTGTLPLSISSISITGPDASEFSIQSAPSSPIAVAGSGNLVVRFTPTSTPVAVKTASVVIANNDPCDGEDPTVLALSGNGVPALAHPYLFLAKEDVNVDEVSGTEGHMHSNDDIKIKKGKPTTHTGNLSAVDNIKVSRDNTIDGDVQGASLNISGSATVTGTQTSSAAASVSIPNNSYSAGTTNISVPAAGSLALTPGSYGNVTVGLSATLSLSSGVYYIKKLDVKEDANLSMTLTTGPITVNAVDDINFDERDTVTISPLGDNGSRWVTFNLLGNKNFDVDDDSRFLGSIYAPNGIVKIGRDVRLKGSIAAKKIDVDKDGIYLHHVAAGVLPKNTRRITEQPASVLLLENYPNPFGPGTPSGSITTVQFSVPVDGSVRLKVYDMLGRVASTLVDAVHTPGIYRVPFDASELKNGVYFYVLEAANTSITRTMTIIK